MSPDRSSVLEADSRLRPKPQASAILGVGTPNTPDHAWRPGNGGEDDGTGQALKMEVLGRLSAGIAHDFNNLLTIILGYTEVALDAVRQDDPLFSTIEEIRAAAERAAALTAGLLSFSRRRSVEQRPVDLGRLLAGMLPMLRRIIGEKITLDSAVEAGSVVLADPSKIEQVVMNLVVNARDAMPTGGRLAIGLSAADPPLASDGTEAGWVVLTVEDTGVGMDTATQAQLFEPFFTTKPAGSGTGLGLSTVSHVVASCGGHVRVASARGAGTVFSVFLPLTDQTTTADPPVPEQAAGPMGRAVVLVAEDEADVRRLIAAALTQAGYHVLEADDGLDALRISRERTGSIDLLVTDEVMPRMNGAELAEQIRAERRGTPVVYLSGYGETVGGQGPGDASRTLLKPFRMSALIDAVRGALANRPADWETVASLSARGGGG